MGKTKTVGGVKRPYRRPAVELLESRCLLATTVSGPVPFFFGGPTPVAATVATGSSTSGTDFNSIIGAAQARSTYGVNGAGMTVAVIDTGVNYNHEALGGGFGPGHKVVAGYDFADNSSNPIASAQHGTAVAGLIASSDPAHPGVAPGADIAALRVFDNNNQGSYSYITAALQWVIDNHTRYNITVVNISLADGNNYAQNWFNNDGGVGGQVTTLIGQLDALNIPVVAAAGNSYAGQQGMGFPAIVPDTISVTGTTATNQVVSDAQRLGATIGGASATDLAAPAVGIVAPSDGNNFSSGDGTSFAAPQVSGAVVLLQQIYEQRFGQLPTVNQLESWLKQGADPVTDPVTGLTIGRLDIPKSAALVPAAPAAQVLTTALPATTQFSVNGQTVTGVTAQQLSSRLTSLFTTLFKKFIPGGNAGSWAKGPTVRIWGVSAKASVGPTQTTGQLHALGKPQQARPSGVLHLLHHQRALAFVLLHRHR